MSKLDFAALLCSRLCHDLVSPVGAINNGLELLAGEQDETMRAAVFDLIEKSTHQTSNKLQFYRLAFGAAGGFSAHLDTREAEKSLHAFLAGSKIDLTWDVGVAELSKGSVKLLLNICLIASEALIRGGSLEVSFKEADHNRLSMTVDAQGERIILPEVIRDALEGRSEEENLEPRSAPAQLACVVADELGGSIAVTTLESDRLAITAAVRANA